MKLLPPVRAPKSRSRLSRIIASRSEARRERRERPAASSKSSGRPFLSRLGWGLDRFLSPFAPVWASKRMQTRFLSERALQLANLLQEHRGFSGASDPEYRTERWNKLERDTDGHLEEDLETLQTRCEELARDNIIVRSAIEGRKANEVGTGIHCQPMVKAFQGMGISIDENRAEQINDGLKDFCERWSQHGVDRSRQFTFAQFQKLVVGDFATYGEVFVEFGDSQFRGPSSFCMQLINPCRVKTPPNKVNDPLVRLGIQYNADDVAVGYWVLTHHPDSSLNVQEQYDYIPRYDPKTGKVRCVHVFEPIVSEQTRGIPWIAWVMNRCKDLDDYWEAELINKQIEACFGINVVGGDGNDNSPMSRATAAATGTDSQGRRTQEVSPGAINHWNEGTTISTMDPQRPGATFSPFIEWSLRSIAAALNYPYELLAKNFFRTTYSSGRLAMMDGHVGFRCRRQTLIDMWLCHVHHRHVWEAMVSGVVPIDILEYREQPHLFERHVWRGQNRGLLDPYKENQGHKIGIECEIETRTGIALEQGGSIDEIEHELLAEGKRQVERQVKLAAYRLELETAAKIPPGSSIVAPGTQSPVTGAGDTQDDDADSVDDADEAESRRAAA